MPVGNGMRQALIPAPAFELAGSVSGAAEAEAEITAAMVRT